MESSLDIKSKIWQCAGEQVMTDITWRIAMDCGEAASTPRIDVICPGLQISYLLSNAITIHHAFYTLIPLESHFLPLLVLFFLAASLPLLPPVPSAALLR